MVKKSKSETDVGVDLGALSPRPVLAEDKPTTTSAPAAADLGARPASAKPATKAASAPAAAKAKPKRDIFTLMSDPRVKRHQKHLGPILKHPILRQLKALKEYRERRSK